MHYSGTFAPYDLQKKSVEFMVDNPRCYNFCSPGTGKTCTSLWAIDNIFKQGQKVLIVSTVSNLLATWGKEIQTNFPHRSFSILTGSKQQRLSKLDADFLVINHDGLTTIADKLPKIDYLIYDEVTAVKNTNTKTFQAVSSLIITNTDMRIIAMTGTPCSNGPMDAYGLIKLLYPEFPYTELGWKLRTMTKINRWTWRPKSNWKELCFKELQPAIRFDIDDINEMADYTVIPHEIPLSNAQKLLYKSLEFSLKTSLEEDVTIKCPKGAAKRNKLLQCISGMIYDIQNKAHEIDFTPRLTALIDIIESHSTPVIVFTSFKSSQLDLYNKLQGKFSVAMINGDITGATRAAIINDFQNGKYQVLLAHPETCSYALTLTASNCIIWYGLPISTEQYVQGNARIRRANEESRIRNKFLIYQFYSSQLEKMHFEKLEGKEFQMEQLLDIVKYNQAA